MIYDVAIVGAGPGGSWAGWQLARGGASVALIDDSHPREKPCGGGVTGRALALLGTSVEALADGVPIAAARFAHADRSTSIPLSAPTEKLRLAVVSRRSFDEGLLQRARQAGARHHATRVVDVSRENGAWRVRTRQGDVTARVLIGADGPGSLVRRRVSRPFDRADLSVAAGYYVHGVSSTQIDIAFEPDPPGYLWAFPRPDHLAAGVCAQADVASSAQLLALTAYWLDRHAPGGARQRYSWPIPSLRVATLERERPAGKGWMLVGDAAGLVDPITREGIFFALTSAEQAAESILRDHDPSRCYIDRLRESIYAELILAARLKARFFRPQFMALLVKAIDRSPAIRTIMADLVAGEQPYHTLRGRLLRTFEWRLMLELFGIR